MISAMWAMRSTLPTMPFDEHPNCIAFSIVETTRQTISTMLFIAIATASRRISLPTSVALRLDVGVCNTPLHPGHYIAWSTHDAIRRGRMRYAPTSWPLRCVALPPSWPLRRHPAWAYRIRPISWPLRCTSSPTMSLRILANHNQSLISNLQPLLRSKRPPDPDLDRAGGAQHRGLVPGLAHQL
jgi:hypothetical protein